MHKLRSLGVLFGVAGLLTAGCATEVPAEEPSSVAESAQTTGCVAFPSNAYPGAPTQICDVFAKTFKFFASGGNPGAYNDAQHWEIGLSIFGFPIDHPHAEAVEGRPDFVQTFERIWLNRDGGCPYGACIARAGAWDLGPSLSPGSTGDCWTSTAIARPLECIPGFGQSTLTQKIDSVGGQKLNYWGLVLTPPGPCSWWDNDQLGQRTCVYTERGKLGFFPENAPRWQWQGELLGVKKKRQESKNCKYTQAKCLCAGGPECPGASTASGCWNTHNECTAATKQACAACPASCTKAARGCS